jgi:hypothetical protein
MHSLRSGLQLEDRLVAPGHRSTHTEETELPRNQHGFKVFDDGNEESGRSFGGPPSTG